MTHEARIQHQQALTMGIMALLVALAAFAFAPQTALAENAPAAPAQETSEAPASEAAEPADSPQDAAPAPVADTPSTTGDTVPAPAEGGPAEDVANTPENTGTDEGTVEAPTTPGTETETAPATGDETLDGTNVTSDNTEGAGNDEDATEEPEIENLDTPAPSDTTGTEPAATAEPQPQPAAPAAGASNAGSIASNTVTFAGTTPTAQAAAGTGATQPATAPASTASLKLEAAATTGSASIHLTSAQLKALSEAITAMRASYTFQPEGIAVPTTVSDALKADIQTAASEAMDYIRANYPQFFYLSNAYGVSTAVARGSFSLTIQLNYTHTAAQVKTMQSKIDAAVKTVQLWIPAGTDEAQKAKAVHDWLVRNCVYDLKASKTSGPAAYGTNNPWTIYGALVDKKAVCQGYTLAFKLMMDKLGIACTYVENTANGETHSWNRVRVNGAWYNVDVTHDDPVYANGTDAGFNVTPSTKYFLKSDAWFAKDSDRGLHEKYAPTGNPATTTAYDNGTNRGTVWKMYGPNASSIALVARTVNWTGKAIAYNGSVTRTGSTGKVTYAYYSDAKCTKAVAAANVKNAGVYYVRATLATDGSWAAATSGAVKLTVNALASSISLAAQTKTYNGKAQAYNGRVVRSGSTGKVTYAYYSDARCTKVVKAANVKNAGTYYVRATLAADGGHKAATSGAVKIVINKAASSIALATNGKLTKRGSNGKVTYAYYTDAACRKGVSAASVKAGKTYFVKATVAADANYKAATSAPVKLKLKASKIALAAQTKAYTGKAQAYTGKVSKSGSGGAVTYTYYSDAKCKKVVKAANVKNAGTYYVKATVAAQGIYAPATSKAVKYTISKPAAKAAAKAAPAATTAAKKTTTIKNNKTPLASGADLAKLAAPEAPAPEPAAQDDGLRTPLAEALVAAAAAAALLFFLAKRRKRNQDETAA